MVLFLVTETLRLLDLYKTLRDDPRNVTNNGILLKQHAREQLTSALNASFPREQPWTEGQVAVKFKNLRSEYVELKWLSKQAGFKEDGVGLSDDWWNGIKRLRHKAHAFKGKLPWVFEAKMKAIVGGYQSKREQQQVWMPVDREEMEEEEEEEEEEEDEGEEKEEESEEKEKENKSQQEQEVNDVKEEIGIIMEQPPAAGQQSDEVEAIALRLQHKRKCKEDVQRNSVKRPPARSYGCGGNCDESLSRSVEQSSVAAAGMARGFQDLTTMFQEEAARCRALEQQVLTDGKETHLLANQRRVLLAIASSLEHSTRATADVAKGYCELVNAFVRGTAETERKFQREAEL